MPFFFFSKNILLINKRKKINTSLQSLRHSIATFLTRELATLSLRCLTIVHVIVVSQCLQCNEKRLDLFITLKQLKTLRPTQTATIMFIYETTIFTLMTHLPSHQWTSYRMNSSIFPRHLDVSRESRRASKFKMTRKILTSVVQRLVNLVSLDISGHTMLDNCTVPHFEEAMGRPRWVTAPRVRAGRWTTAFRSSLFFFSPSFSVEPCKSSIYPFQELKRPLQFLGLYDTTLCNVTHIPAYKVLGM